MQARALLAAVVLLSTWTAAQQPSAPPEPNSDPIYRQLRHIQTSGDAVAVSNLVLNRETARFRLDGKLTLLAPVAGKITGAVFTGDGILTVRPPLPEEERSLSLLTRAPEFVERFNTMVLRFTDGTEAEIRKAGTATTADGNAGTALERAQQAARHKLHWNLSARVLQDVLDPAAAGLFVAFVEGKNYSQDMLFVIDPFGVAVTGEAEYSRIVFPEVAPEEIALLTFDDAKFGVWTAHHYPAEYKNGSARGTQDNSTCRIAHQKLDVVIEKSGYLRGDAQTTVVSRLAGLRTLRFELFPTLRVRRVASVDGQPLAFIQEDKGDDPQYWVILPKALGPDESVTIRTVYEGKDAVWNEGGGNYYPRARSNWYPAHRVGQYATYEMTFHIPKNMTMLATGTLVSESKSDENVSVWKSDIPLAVAGFNFGQFKRQQVKLDKPAVEITSYANLDPPDWVAHLKDAAGDKDLSIGMDRFHGTGPALGHMETTALMKVPIAQAQLAVPLYTSYFGPMSYSQMGLSQQTACTFGQSWPELVYLPICGFFDTTVRDQLGFHDSGGHGYWTMVTPHEIAHQWWGQTVGWNSYRDQWMSEGFAEFSASLYLQIIDKNPTEFIKFWRDQRVLLTERNKEGHRPIDAGPVTLGYRMYNTRAGFSVPRRLIYPKGGYILHMIRMMMWTPQNGDAAFQAMMREFVETYRNRAASTEDFKQMVEKHMTPGMDLDKNRRMDWFFNEYVYGTALPSYKFEYSLQPANSGATLDVELVQSNVSDAFRMLVPIYVELSDGHIVRLGQVPMAGNSTFSKKGIPLKVATRPKRVFINYYNDVLATN